MLQNNFNLVNFQQEKCKNVEYKSCIPINKVRKYFIGFALQPEEEEKEDKNHLLYVLLSLK